MPRQSNEIMDGLIPGYGKIRKRGCSSSSSSSSKLHNYRFKRAIMVGKTRIGSGSRSSTPAPSWRMTPSLKSKLDGGGGEYEGGGGDGGGRSRPVSARKLAATLWEMNEMPSPEMMTRRRTEKMNRPGSLPPHLSDPSHTPVSESTDRSKNVCHHRTSVSLRSRLEDNHGAVFDSLSNAGLMEIETRSRVQTPAGSTVGVKTRLKDVSNALTTSKELLKIIHRMWAHDNLPSSSMSLISALHTELERARLQVNQFIKDQTFDQTDINYLLNRFAEEKASWKTKEQHTIDSVIESVAAELDVERKSRQKLESVNKKLGRELAETKASFTKTLKELESEKRAREIMEQVCDELAVDFGQDRAEAKELKRVTVKAHEEVEMLHLADKLREERVQMKLAEAKHQFEEKNALVDQLRSQLEAFIGNKNDEDDNVDEKDSGESEDLHSIELNMDNNNKSFKWAHNFKKDSIEGEVKGRKSVNAKKVKALKKSDSSIQRSISDGNEYILDLDKQTSRRSHGDELQRYESVKGLRDRILTSSKMCLTKDFSTPPATKPRTGDARAEILNCRRSKK